MMKFLYSCIFDLDGVIVDSAKYHYITWKRLTNSLGFDLTVEQNESLKGIGRNETLDIILKLGGLQFDKEKKKKLANLKNDWYIECISDMDSSEILPGVVEFLESLKFHNVKLAIASSSKNAIPILDKIGLKKYFNVIVDGHQITKSKPNPEVFIKACHKLNIRNTQSIVFEDAKIGIKAAIEANMLAIGVGSKQELNEAHIVIDSFVNLDFNKLVAMINNLAY